MPLYEFKCPKCGIIFDNIVKAGITTTICKCGNIADKHFTTNVKIQTFPKQGIHLEHVGPQGKTFHSKQEMITYARENKLELGALL